MLLYVQRPYGLSGTGSPERPPRLSYWFWALFVQCCFTSIETVRTFRDGEPRTSTSTFVLVLSSVRSMLLYVQRPYGLSGTGSPGRPPRLSYWFWALFVQCCFTSTETVRTFRDGEPRTSTSTFVLVLSSVRSMLLYVHRNRTDL